MRLICALCVLYRKVTKGSSYFTNFSLLVSFVLCPSAHDPESILGVPSKILKHVLRTEDQASRGLAGVAMSWNAEASP